MKVLAIETSGRVGSLAVMSADGEHTRNVASEQLPESARSAKSLLPAAQSLLQHCNWQLKELNLICVASGPGSFTGLRIGVTVAKTLAYATGAELVEVNSLAAIAAGITQPYQNLWTVLDAQRGELFIEKFSNGWQTNRKEMPTTSIQKADSWIEQLAQGDLVAGPPLTKLAADLPAGVTAAESKWWSPKADFVGSLGATAYRAGFALDPIQLVPKYYRKSAAEEKADRTATKS